ncbi:hypothetical protein PtA15_1A862 [Puccinia triticina]|uniref:Uncharacterized protein n=1 Tax=Puccinia triticina TaxID=208348 RepID=A0ABY7C8M7_9BASI|nr:uncharacterized protein PtA15_1A862 [Puccinia triticina]WAQ81520.1 hypothetical protein PtA15_1A862 [Puccinia triticina]
MGNNPATGHPGVNPTNYSLSTPHPAQSQSGEMMTPAHSWIGPPPLAYPISPVPGVNNHQPWAPSPTGSNARPSVSSQTSSLETWVRETSCPVLLAEDLQSYGSRASRRLRVADTPFPQVQAELNRQDEAFRAAHLPPNIAQGDALERLLCDTAL